MNVLSCNDSVWIEAFSGLRVTAFWQLVELVRRRGGDAPTGGRASSKNYRFSANVQIVIDIDTRLVVAVGRPGRGNCGDAPAFRTSGVADDIDTAGIDIVLADGACIGTGCVVPHRKRPECLSWPRS